ncbi:MAG: glycosyltransferase family 4 protein [Candidatus Syntrophoarchaeum sp.]|nr:glycosyltransferase family 4 protein [Candidatus Syntrophoarchaeum sp.]
MITRIAFFSWESLHSIKVGGMGVHVSKLAEALVRDGKEVHIFTRRGEGQGAYELIKGVHYHRCLFDYSPDFIAEIRNMCGAFAYHFFEVEREFGRFDVIHGHDWLSVYALEWIKKVRDVPAVMTFHSTEYGRCGNNLYDGMSRAVRDIEWWGGYIADQVITVSKNLKREIGWLFSIPDYKVEVVPNGIDSGWFTVDIEKNEAKKRYGIGTDDPTCLFVGRMNHQKGPDLLVEALPDLISKFPDAKFLWVGEGYLKAGVEQRACDLGVHDACRFLGFVPEAELPGAYAAADAVCVPSRNEPFGIVVLEAWSLANPVVVTHNGFDFVDHGKDGLKVYTWPDSIAWGIGGIFSDPEWADLMGRNGKQKARDFSWDAVAEKTMEVYRRC